MSDALEKAEAAAREAAASSAAVQVALAAVELAKTAQQPAPPPPCGHQHPPRRSAGEWIGIGAAVCVGGIGIAFASIALAILGGVAAIVVLVLRDLWKDMQRKG